MSLSRLLRADTLAACTTVATLRLVAGSRATDAHVDTFTFTGIIIREEEGYSSLCPELDVASVGNTPEEAKAMLLEAATLHIEGAIEDGMPYLRPIPSADDPRSATPGSNTEVFRFHVDVAVHAHV